MGGPTLPTLHKHKETLYPGGTFDGVELIKGWIAEKDLTNERIIWTLREDVEIDSDLAE